VRICKVLNEHSPIYTDEFYRKIEVDPEYDSRLYVMLQQTKERFRDTADKHFE